MKIIHDHHTGTKRPRKRKSHPGSARRAARAPGPRPPPQSKGRRRAPTRSRFAPPRAARPSGCAAPEDAQNAEEASPPGRPREAWKSRSRRRHGFGDEQVIYHEAVRLRRPRATDHHRRPPAGNICPTLHPSPGPRITRTASFATPTVNGPEASSDSAGQGARVHRVEAGIVDEAGRRTVRPVVLSSTVAREECIYRPPQRRATSCEEPDEEPMLFPTDLQTYPGRTYPEFSTPIRIHENLEAQHLVNAMAVLGCHCGKRLRHEPGVILKTASASLSMAATRSLRCQCIEFCACYLAGFLE